MGGCIVFFRFVHPPVAKVLHAICYTKLTTELEVVVVSVRYSRTEEDDIFINRENGTFHPLALTIFWMIHHELLGL